MNIKTIILIICAIVIILLASFAINNNNSQTNDAEASYKIGLVYATIGDAGPWGEMSLKGAQMAIDEINSDPKLAGKFEFFVETSDSSSVGLISATKKVLDVHKVDAIAGPSWIDVYHGPAELVKGTNTIMVTADSGIEALTGGKKLDNVFSTWYRSDAKARLLTDHLIKLGKKNVLVIVPHDPFYIDFSDRIVKYLGDKNITSTREYLTSDPKDVKAILLKAKTQNPDVVFFSSYDPANLSEFFKSYKSYIGGVDVYVDEMLNDFLGTDGFEGLVEGAYYFHAMKPASKFVEKFEAKYGTSPLFGAGTAYDSINIIKETLLNSTPEEREQYLQNHTFDTVSYGKITFDEIGGVKSKNNQFDLFKVENDKGVKISW